MLIEIKLRQLLCMCFMYVNTRLSGTGRSVSVGCASPMEMISAKDKELLETGYLV